MGNLICKCGEIIENANIDYSNKENEFGEEYSEIEAECYKCGTNWEATRWGSCDSTEEAKEQLAHVNDLKYELEGL